MREQADVLRGVKSSLLAYQSNINAHWSGVEMAPVNQAITFHMTKLASMATELDTTSYEIVREAEAILAEEMDMD